MRLGVAVVLGLALCWYGKRLFSIVLGLVAFLVAWRVSAQLLVEISSSESLIRWGSLGFGVIGGLLAGFLFRAYLFVAGALFGWLLVSGWFPTASILLRAAGAVATGALLFAFSDVLIVVLSSLVGALLLAGGASGLLERLLLGVPPLVIAAGSLLLAAAGATAQLTRKPR